MRIVSAFLSLTFSIPVVAEEEAALSDHGKMALGVSLPLESAGGISIWRVRPTTMLGFEIGSSDVSFARRDYPDGTENHTAFLLNPALTVKRFRPLRHDVAPFSYQTISATVVYLGRPYRDEMYWYARVGMGFGVAWFPFKRVSLSIRQGVTLSFRHDYVNPPQSEYERDGVRTIPLNGAKTVHLSVHTMRLLALFHF